MPPPLLSVLMSVHNGERYVEESIASILRQTFSDFEFIIVDDGSSDGTGLILERFAKKDVRVRIITKGRRIGLASSLNCALRSSLGTYVARQDADDLSLPGRLAVQVDFLKRNERIGLVGTWGTEIDHQGNLIGPLRRHPTSDPMLKWLLLFRNTFIHTSVMARKDVLMIVGAYDRAFETSQDYDLWSRLCHHTSFANIAEELVLYRTHPGQIGAMLSRLQKDNSRRISRRNLSEIGAVKTPWQFDAVHRVLGNSSKRSSLDVVITARLLPSVFLKFLRTYDFDSQAVSDVREMVTRELLRGKRHCLSSIVESPLRGAQQSLLLGSSMLRPSQMLSIVRRFRAQRKRHSS